MTQGCAWLDVLSGMDLAVCCACMVVAAEVSGGGKCSCAWGYVHGQKVCSCSCWQLAGETAGWTGSPTIVRNLLLLSYALGFEAVSRPGAPTRPKRSLSRHADQAFFCCPWRLPGQAHRRQCGDHPAG
jgi:hypothetical protein